ncbi:MAG: amidohydrolase, partial [Gemmatimonas sp.]
MYARPPQRRLDILTILTVTSFTSSMHHPSQPPVEPISLAVVNARIWTGDSRRPWADAMAISGERVTTVGSSAEVRKLASPETHVINARGMMVVPGFIDAHVHFLDGGFGLASVHLRDAKTPHEFERRIGEYAKTLPPGAWITNGDWDHEQWGGELPRRDWIDSVTPNNPVWVGRLDGHMSLANEAALRAAGITKATEEVAGGTIVRDAHGEPTGILKDNAMSLVNRVQPGPSAEDEDRALDAAMRYVAANGVTSVTHMGSWSDLAVFERAHAAGRLETRIYAAVPLASWERLR